VGDRGLPARLDAAELTAPQLLPFQVATRSAFGLPPASVKSPPT
jgi:hypothetical protein